MKCSCKNLSKLIIPKHVAIIMDGNGRWAKKKGKLRIIGHKAGIKSIKNSIRFALTKKINSLTLFAFSSENWKRPEQEIKSLMELFTFTLNNEIKTLHNNNIILKIIGDISRFNKHIKEEILKAQELTKNNNGLKLNIAANYGGRWDIVNSVKQIYKKIKNGELSIKNVNEKTINNYICMNDQKNIDLVIRTGGEHRISNFLLWQIAYSELYFTNVLWPDFNEIAFQDAINAFSKRKRRYGGTESNNEFIQ
ncbi:polyprenyl diphosphate synthase [Candidatus Providencia siddallii]|uniref:Ditrans,polycis-undecaprenyl-diphosphate synthase ((2E,6E)-farnesyl-diphosphate specific) n=1 Tax=Candidatus Providencia siddallii TaxID=1715285 RepID=A0ABM9NNY2_9GAMM